MTDRHLRGPFSCPSAASITNFVRTRAALVLTVVCSGAGLQPAMAATRITAAAQLVTIHPEGVASNRGIGPVRLEESQADVTRALGAGHEVESGTEFGEIYSGYNYRSGTITIEVGYVSGLVSGVSTKSPKAILFGHRLSDGARIFRSILRHRHGWRIDSCHHRTFTALAPGGPGTGIEWKNGRPILVMIDAGGMLDDCAVL